MKNSEQTSTVPQRAYAAENPYMQLAIEEARKGIYAGDGGPFGSVVVKEGKIIATGHNCVLSHNDPTCHGEVSAIRNAGAALGTHDLSGCDVYTTGEPCPMCLCACMWANIGKIYYGCTIEDNTAIGFRDSRFDELLGGRKKVESYLVELDREACLALFEEYNNIKTRKLY